MPVPKNKSSSAYSLQNNVKLVRGGKEYFELLIDSINRSAVSIHLQTYIYADDETGRLVAAALKNAVKRNVQVYVLVDGYASQSLAQSFIDDVRASGIQFRFFEPFFKTKNFYFGRRMHHKIFVADAKFALVGGINIADRYNDTLEQDAWLDFAVYINGEIAQQLCKVCWQAWKNFPTRTPHTPCEQNLIDYSINNTATCKVRIRRNDWVKRRNEISFSYVEMIRNAQSHITILCSYFLPGKIIRKALRKAAARGVKITVITAGPSDIMMAKKAERWLYDWLLRYHIELFEYQPVVLHAKVAVCDNEWITIGSYNLNNISAYASIELNLDIQNTLIAANMQQRIDELIEKECISITLENHHKTNHIFNQFTRWFSYQFIRVVFYLLTFYYKQKR